MTSADDMLAQNAAVTAALLAVIIAGLTVYMIATRNRIRRSMNRPRSSVRDRYAELQQRTRLSRDLEEVMADLDDLARQINGKLDLRFAKLEAVIRDADARIDELTRLLRKAQGEPTLDIVVGGDEAMAGEPMRRDSAGGEAAQVSATSSDRTMHADVYKLADEGRSPVEIAEQTNRTAGEVELILALRRAKDGRSDAATYSAPSAAE